MQDSRTRKDNEAKQDHALPKYEHSDWWYPRWSRVAVSEKTQPQRGAQSTSASEKLVVCRA